MDLWTYRGGSGIVIYVHANPAIANDQLRWSLMRVEVPNPFGDLDAMGYSYPFAPDRKDCYSAWMLWSTS